MLALREVDGDHSGDNQSLCVLEVIVEYGIASKLGFFVMDNASNNDTLIMGLSKRK